MKRKFWNWIKNQDESGSEMRTLFLNGEISDETWYGDEVTPKLFKDELGAGNGPITVWINSPGGDVFAAAQIYNMLMDAESWFNAKKAVELGFADKILFGDGQGDVTNDAGVGITVGDEMSAPVMFSRQAVMNSMLSKLIPPKKPAEKRTPVDQLEKRLSLLSC